MESPGTNTSLESKAFELLAAGQVSAAAAIIAAMPDQEAALDALAQMCNLAYRELKNVPAMVSLAWEAVGVGLRCAATAPDAETARRYKDSARKVAYNAGANCWPGWGDEVEIRPADIAEGLKLAERSYELVSELGLGQKATGTALWLVGALQMAAGHPSTAIARFVSAEEAFHAAELPTQAAMARGYTALARQMVPEPHDRDVESLETILLSLRRMESREAKFFADQLVTAEKFFSLRR